VRTLDFAIEFHRVICAVATGNSPDVVCGTSKQLAALSHGITATKRGVDATR